MKSIFPDALGSLTSITERLRSEFNCGDQSEEFAKILLEIDPIFQESLVHFWTTGELINVGSGIRSIESLVMTRQARSIPVAFVMLHIRMHSIDIIVPEEDTERVMREFGLDPKDFEE